jgi:hypothetical protein
LTTEISRDGLFGVAEELRRFKRMPFFDTGILATPENETCYTTNYTRNMPVRKGKIIS